MLIGVKKRFVFIANSKAGSTSIESVLTPHAEINRVGSAKRKHIGWREVRAEYGFLFDDESFRPEFFFRFGVIREPVDWVRSWYNYRRFGKHRDIAQNISFEAFWGSNDWVKRRQQKDRFVDEDGICRFDLIIPMEKLGASLPVVFKKFGVCDVTLQRKNKSKGTLSRAGISDGLIEEINRHYAEDYALWGEWQSRSSQVLNQISASEGYVCDTSTGRNTIKHECPVVEMVQVKKNEGLGTTDSVAEFVGSVVLKSSVKRMDWMLLAVVAGREYPVCWGLPSPKVAARFLSNTNAAKARFKVVDVPSAENEAMMELWLIGGAGERFRLFKTGQV